MKNFLLVIILFGMASCSQVSLLNIKSVPNEAKVFARPLGSTERVELGTTPLEMKSTEIQKKLNSDGLIIIELEREQYFKEEFYLSDYSNRNIDISYNLRQSPKIAQAQNVDIIISKLFACQKFVKVKRFKDCQTILTSLKKKFPEVSTIYEFEGSIFYITKDKRKALQSFITALKFNPDNSEARRMIGVIKGNKKQ
jgi:hypothetical protein